MRIEDYGLIGDLETAALVSRHGSIDWLCLPRFDAAACFCALLGDEHNGRWLLFPASEPRRVSRRYLPGTLVLETTVETDEGAVRLVDCMPPREGAAQVVRLVEGVRGRVPMRMELAIRLDYGRSVPWVTRVEGGIGAVLGPDALRLLSPVATGGRDMTTVAHFTVGAGEQVPFTLSWHPSHEAPAPPRDPLAEVARTCAFWEGWSARSAYRGDWHEAVTTSLVVLKALTHRGTGGIVAAPTTSLPEALGGVRNWDYRYCWVRDAALTLSAFLRCGYLQEAGAFRDWLMRATAGDAAQAQIMYGVAGERRLPELPLDWLAGYEGSRPVRAGNAAADQFQLDVYGELLDVAHLGRMTARALGLPASQVVPETMWRRNLAMLSFVESVWREPDEGIWEVRGPRRHFTHSKVMAWVVFDRAVRAVEEFGLEGPVDRWRSLREEVHAEVCERGYDPERRTFTQHYGSRELDASLLLIPASGFLPPEDERVRGTVEAVRRELTHDGLVYRYSTGEGDGAVDGLPGREGAFLPCSFWLVDCLVMTGRHDEARALFERLLDLRNDLGLLAEEYDPFARRQVGNFPQAFTHLALVNSAQRLSSGG